MENFTSRSPVHTEPRSEVTNDLLAIVFTSPGILPGLLRNKATHHTWELFITIVINYHTCQWLHQENERVNLLRDKPHISIIARGTFAFPQNLPLQNDIDLRKGWARSGRVSVCKCTGRPGSKVYVYLGRLSHKKEPFVSCFMPSARTTMGLKSWNVTTGD